MTIASPRAAGEVQRLLDLEAGEVQSVVILLDATEKTAVVRGRSSG
jgi:hypothetical protein